MPCHDWGDHDDPHVSHSLPETSRRPRNFTRMVSFDSVGSRSSWGMPPSMYSSSPDSDPTRTQPMFVRLNSGISSVTEPSIKEEGEEEDAECVSFYEPESQEVCL